MSKYQTRTEPPIPLKCLVCGGEDFTHAVKTWTDNPFYPREPNSKPECNFYFGYARYTCNHCGFMMNFDIDKSPQVPAK